MRSSPFAGKLAQALLPAAPALSPAPAPRLSRLLLAALLFPVIVAAQPAPYRVEIAASRTWVLSARSLQLEARGLGRFGERIPDIRWTWASSNPIVAAVNATGEVLGRAPGVAQIEASYAGVAGVFTVAVHPLRLEIVPARLELEAGAEGRLQARAVDADGNPIAAAAPVSWSSTIDGIASVAGGNVRALAAGSATVSARMSLGGGVSFGGQALVLVHRRSDFRFERLLDSNFTFSQVELRNLGQIAYSSGRMAFVAALSHGGQGLFVYDGVLRLIAATGQTIDGLPVAAFNSASINSRGDVVTQFQIQGQGQAVALFRGGNPANASVPITQAGQCCLCCYNLTRDSLSDDGSLLYSAWAWDVSARYMLYRSPDGRSERIPNPSEGAVQPTWNFATVGSRRALFEATFGSRSGWFFWDGQTTRRVVSTGDVVLGRLVNGIGAPPVALPSGEAYFSMWGPNFGNTVFRWNGGAWSTVLEQRAYGSRTINRIDRVDGAAADSIVFQGDVGGAYGLFRLRGGAVEDVALIGQDRAFSAIWQAVLAADGSVLVSGSTATVAARVARVTGGVPSTLFDSGRRIDGNLPISVLWDQPSGGDASTRVVRTASNALLRVGANQATVVLGPGDLLPDGARITWIGDTAANDRGEWIAQAATTADARILAWRNGRIETLLRGNNSVRLPTGESVHWINGRVALNAQGQFLALVNADSSQRFVLFGSTSGPRVVMTPGQPAPGGGVYNWPNQVALDDSGRALFTQDGPGTQAVWLWENGQARSLIRTGDRVPAGFLTQSLQVAAAGNQLYVTAGEFNNNRQLLRLDGAALRPVVATGDRLSFGPAIAGFFQGIIKVAPGGELALPAGLGNGVNAAVIRGVDGVDRVLAQSGARIGPGEWAADIVDVTSTGNGVHYVTVRLLTSDNRYVLYRVTPR